MFDDINEIEKAIYTIKNDYDFKKLYQQHNATRQAIDLATEALEYRKLQLLLSGCTNPDLVKSETMSLVGGIDMYHPGKRYMRGPSPKGRKVRYLDKNGYDGDRKFANKYMKKGDVLTVKEIYVHNCNSDVEFEEIPDYGFNTVMFEDVED